MNSIKKPAGFQKLSKGESRESQKARTSSALPPPSLSRGERRQLTQEQMVACEQVVGLPMGERVTLLNLSIGPGILLYKTRGV